MTAALSTDYLFWAFKTLMPGRYRHLLGVPKAFAASPADLATLDQVAESIFPVGPRRHGAVFDTVVGNPYVNNCPLQDITPPTLLIHAADDSLAPYETAVRAAARMPKARFVTIDRGGHEFLGHEALVRQAISESLGMQLLASV
jgi:pimeloyl-ACP methyl ester carboxylesterase